MIFTPRSPIPPFLAVALTASMLAFGVGEPEARAQKANITQKERREAKRLFNKAHLAYRRGDYEEAILKWEQSFELSGEPLISLSIANAYERLGDSKQALAYLKRWRTKAPRREHEELDGRIEALESRVAEDEANEKARKEAEEKRLAAEKERLRQERLKGLERKEGEELDDGSNVWMPIGWSLVGVGGAAVIVGVALDGVAASKRPSEDEACTSSDAGLLCRDQFRDDIESSNTMAVVGDALWISGAVLAAGGVVVLLTLAQDDDPGAGGDTAVVPWMGPTGGGAVISGRF